MTTSFANVTSGNMELTPCRVKFDGIDVGGTKGNVKVSINFKKADIKADQLGDTVLDRVVSGAEIKIETILTEIKNKDNWKVVFPFAKKVGTGPFSIYFDSQVGAHDLAYAKQLSLHPLSKSDADLDGDLLFFKATAESVSEITFGPTEQQGLKVVWNIYPDTSVQPARYLIQGDPTLGIVAALIGTPVFTGTGNGVISSLVAHSGKTKTETIIVKCVGIPAANQSNWIVEGSLTGVIGYFSIVAGSFSFSSDYIDFSLADGTTDFIIGDYFTIPSTAANYV